MSGNGEAKVVMLLCGDLHLSHKPPVARSAELDWYAAMARPLAELRSLAEDHGVPICCAGDVFDKYLQPPECVNFAIRELPKMYAVAGQHDLVHHDYSQLRRSAYWTLCEAGKIVNLAPGEPVEVPGACPIRLHGFPFGFPVQPLRDPHDMLVEVVVVHAYLWCKGRGYPGAPEERRVKAVRRDLTGYDVAVYGDNHIPFDMPGAEGRPCIFNAGGFLRRKRNEIGYCPRVGLLRSDGTVESYELDCSKDRFLDAEEVAQVMDGIGFQGFVEELAALGGSAIDFADAIKRTLEREKVAPEVKRIVLQMMEDGK